MKKVTFPVSVDCVVFMYEEGNLMVALVQRKNPPFQGMWALPGGFVEGDETVEGTAARELEEETGLRAVPLEQLSVFSKRGRDPRGPIITVAFFGLAQQGSELAASDDAAAAKWWPAQEVPPLAFDHNEIYSLALEIVREIPKF